MNATNSELLSKSYDDFLQNELRDPELAAAYLSAAAEDGSIEQLMLALRAVAEAHGGIGAVAESAHLNRQTMYRTLSNDGNPTIATLLSILQVMGLNVAFVPASRR
ncbi:MAG: DNA-binding protein [Caldilinea sp.]